MSTHGNKAFAAEFCNMVGTDLISKVLEYVTGTEHCLVT